MAITLDFGKCAACGESNSKTLQNCRACGAALPWAKGIKNSVSTPSGATPNPSSKPKIGLGDLAYGAMAVQLLGGLIFVAGAFFWLGNVLRFFPTFPGVGYITMLIGGALWGFGQNMD